MSDELKQSILWWLSEDGYAIAHFIDGYGLTMRNGGGKWGETYPEEVLNAMVVDGTLEKIEYGDFWITREGRKQDAMRRYGLVSAQ